jgi:hypothetical protein
MYTELSTYRIAIADQCPRNLESLNYPLVATCMSQAESLLPPRRLSQTRESLCWSLVIWILRRTKSPSLKLQELMLRDDIACWCFADCMTAASCNSPNFFKSSTRELLDYSLEYCWTQMDLWSTSVGNVASEPYTKEKGVCPVARFRVIRRAHNIDDNSFICFLT